MSNDPFESNPYAPSAQAPMMPPGGQTVGDLTPEGMKKVEAIIKDAGQFWIAILLCFLCGALGPIIIGPWYLVRLFQWNKISTAHPWLLDPNAAQGSLQQKFKSSKWKLIVGLVFGAITLVLVGLFLVASIGAAAANPNGAAPGN